MAFLSPLSSSWGVGAAPAREERTDRLSRCLEDKPVPTWVSEVTVTGHEVGADHLGAEQSRGAGRVAGRLQSGSESVPMYSKATLCLVVSWPPTRGQWLLRQHQLGHKALEDFTLC